MVPVVNSMEELKQYLSNTGGNSYNETGAFISATSSSGTYDLNNLQVTNGGVDANQYYQQGVTTGDYNNLGVTDGTSYPISGENVGYNQYYQGDTTGTTNYYPGVEGTTNVDYTLNTQPTGTFDLNNLNMGNNYEISATAGSTMTFSGEQGTTDYNTYGATQDITNSTYVTPTQNYSYNYSYSNPTTSAQY